MNYVLAYWDAIESGQVVVSRRVRKVYQRLAKEIRNPDPDSPYYFDEEAGTRPIDFAERFCKQSQGVIGAPLELELFQKAYVQALFGFLEKDTDAAAIGKRCSWWGGKTASRRCWRQSRYTC